MNNSSSNVTGKDTEHETDPTDTKQSTRYEIFTCKEDRELRHRASGHEDRQEQPSSAPQQQGQRQALKEVMTELHWRQYRRPQTLPGKKIEFL